MRRRAIALTVLAALFAAVVAVLPPHATARAATESEGYFALSDGTRLRYTVLLPDGDGPFPVVLQLSGYNNGNNVRDGTFGKMVDLVVADGIAVIGVNLRGSGCSEGTFGPFVSQWAEDGVEVVEWVADQPWSDGNVAMAGVSYPAIVSLVTAVRRPPSLKAVMPAVPVTDLYRDVGYPGGIFNQTFATVWTFIQKYGTLFGLQETAEGDLDCPTAIPTQNDPTDITGVQAASNPYIDSMPRYREFLMPNHLERVDVPALVYTAWQDEQLGSRALYGYEHLDLSRTWVLGSNGDHIGFAGSAWYQQVGLEFLGHFLRGGAPEDFDRPHVMLPHDVRKGDATFDEMTTSDTYPVPTVTTTLYGHGDGTFALAPADAPTTLDYAYPLPAPSVPVGIDVGAGVNPEAYNEAYKAPIPPGGSVAWTTPALAEDLQVTGPGSVDLWLDSTADDVDLQVTLTEVRPDGDELYVQRGWLRASHRALDPALSTATRPWQTHLEADAVPLEPGVNALRVELWPVNHVFRAGSALRLYVEAPVGFTGFRQLQYLPTPALNTIHLGPDTPTRFVFGRIAHPAVTTPLPPCDTLLNMPCRTSPSAVPAGELAFAPAPAPTPEDPRTVPAPAPTPTTPDESLPATGGGALAASVLALAVALAMGRRRTDTRSVNGGRASVAR